MEDKNKGSSPDCKSNTGLISYLYLHVHLKGFGVNGTKDGECICQLMHQISMPNIPFGLNV